MTHTVKNNESQDTRHTEEKIVTPPLVSVVMPTYNHAQFLVEAIQSVLKQSYAHLELIVIDNYSTDNTPGIVASFNDPRIRYFQFANHGIIAASRNFGIQKAQGKYIAFIDSDDVWFSEKLAQQVTVLENDPHIGLTFSLFSVDDPKGKWHEKIFGPKDHTINGYIYEYLLRNNFVISSSTVVRASLIKEVGPFDESKELICVEDYDLWLRIAQKSKLCFVPEILGKYRLHAVNMSSNQERFQKHLRVLDKHFHSGSASESQIQRAKANIFFREGWRQLEINVSLARYYFIQTLKLSRGNCKLLGISCTGMVFSLLPFVFRWVRKHNWDERIGCAMMNPQNL